ncbi:non-hydrolyzing UDP-N-acetylglucosamine 2-epimerase [Vagococcus vulneris]|uniref:UDP-N-acetylglucosamine 2-epimerase (non-hydrolyzing) n=1 Tax=Vagococcus vulneris TaxID=1977869 RepID=A0A429ZZV5_9ENTE|nr:UDP-N-acetylglucosamine 2-epimerase (non-hydrolyzing) [Vagococcus vulneris]RST99564.1 UDP-N-acetylglucosamine 2-epimerase (non-hydrolyzing) [Vagococcus vulneris]
MKKVMSVFGTRPEAIKMAPLIKELEMHKEAIESVVVVTAQHREMLDQVLDIFDITPDYDLNIMQKNQSLSQMTSRVLMQIDDILLKEQPDIVLVHGDTTTSFVAGLAAFYHQIKIGHVEAGLRTWDKMAPFPEEMNRQMTDVLSDVYFAPTELSRQNLLKQNIPDEKIYVTGNTVVDALQQTTKMGFTHQVVSDLKADSRKILLTMHRRENIGEPMEQVFNAVKRVVEADETIEVIYPVHPNPKVKSLAKEVLGSHPQIHLIEPLDVVGFHNCMSQVDLILSDSGGVQEEAPSLKKPVLVLRDSTERPEGIETGILKVVGTEEEKVYKEITHILNNSEVYNKVTNQPNPYGDGHASQKIVEILYNII